MSMGRKHVMVFEIEAQVRTEDVAKLRAAVTKRPSPNLVFANADGDEDDETTADYTEFYVAYGPVRGANRTDVTRFLDRNDVGYVLDETTAVTTYACGCASSSQPCTDGVAPTPAEPAAPDAGSGWQAGDDW